MLVRQSRNTYIRVTKDFGYIYNQESKLDRMFNETGTDYLACLSRTPQDVETIITSKLMPLYDGVSREDLSSDFISFLLDLQRMGFLLIGDSLEKLDEDELTMGDRLNTFIEYAQNSSDSNEDMMTTQSFAYSSSKQNPYLMSLQFELTAKCNERCIHCYIPNQKKDKGQEMSLSLFENIIKQFSDLGGLQVSLSGGEIFLHKDIWKMVDICRNYDMQIVLLSNLFFLKEDDVKKMKDANVSMVQTSLYSMKPEIHDAITQIKGSYVKTRNAIETLVHNHIPVSISCPILKANKNCYEDILQYAHSLGIKANTDFILMGRENLETDNLANRISLEDCEKIIRLILENNMKDTNDYIKKNSKKNLKALLNGDMSVCAAGINNLCISANGDAYPCNGWQTFLSGNVKTESLAEIWHNSTVLNRIRSIKRSDFPECAACDAAEYCNICMARNCNESNGNPLQLNPHFCEIAHLNKRIYEESFGK